MLRAEKLIPWKVSIFWWNQTCDPWRLGKIYPLAPSLTCLTARPPELHNLLQSVTISLFDLVMFNIKSSKTSLATYPHRVQAKIDLCVRWGKHHNLRIHLPQVLLNLYTSTLVSYHELHRSVNISVRSSGMKPKYYNVNLLNQLWD